jgi:uncharacterized membrane protein YkoI
MRSFRFLYATFAVTILMTGAQITVAATPAELQALSRAKLSLTQAIEAAERQGDGKAIEAEFEARDNQASRYEVKVLGRDKLVAYTLDADTGKVLETSNEAIEKLFTRLQPDDVRGARTTLAQAIGIAEQHTNGKVIDAEVDREGDSVRYDLTVAKSDGSERELEIDGASGRIVESR